MNDGVEKWNTNFRLEHSVERNRATFSDVPLFPAGATQKDMFHSLFKGVFRKLLSMVNNRSLVFWLMKANFPFPSSSPKGRPTISYNVCRFSNLFVIQIFQHSAKVVDKYIKGSSEHSNVPPDQPVT